MTQPLTRRTAVALLAGAAVEAIHAGAGRAAVAAPLAFSAYAAKGADLPHAAREANAAGWARAVADATAAGRVLLIDGVFETVGDLSTKGGLTVEWAPGGLIVPYPLANPAYPGQGSRTGAIFTNLDPRDGSAGFPSARQSDVTFLNPQIDCANVVGSNAIGMARGIARARVLGGYIRNVAAHDGTIEGFGGKGVIYEFGAYDCRVEGTRVENAFCGFEVQGVEGRFPGPEGASKAARDISIFGHAERCEYACLVKSGTGSHGVVTTDPDVLRCDIDITYRNCGHVRTPDRAGLERQKGAVIGLIDGVGSSIRARGGNDPDYPAVEPGYAPYGSGRASGGLGGPIGAVVKGWFRDCRIDVEHRGDADAALAIRRLYESADGGAKGAGTIPDVLRNEVRIRVEGAVGALARSELRDEDLTGRLARVGNGGDEDGRVAGRDIGEEISPNGARDPGTRRAMLDPSTRSAISGDYVGRRLRAVDDLGARRDYEIAAYDATSGEVVLTGAPTRALSAGTAYRISGRGLAPEPSDVGGRYELRARAFERAMDRTCATFAAARLIGGDMDGRDDMDMSFAAAAALRLK